MPSRHFPSARAVHSAARILDRSRIEHLTRHLFPARLHRFCMRAIHRTADFARTPESFIFEDEDVPYDAYAAKLDAFFGDDATSTDDPHDASASPAVTPTAVTSAAPATATPPILTTTGMPFGKSFRNDFLDDFLLWLLLVHLLLQRLLPHAAVRLSVSLLERGVLRHRIAYVSAACGRRKRERAHR